MLQNYQIVFHLFKYFAFISTAVASNGYIPSGNSVIYQIDGTALPQIAYSNAQTPPPYNLQTSAQYNSPPGMPQFAVAQFIRAEPLAASTNGIEQNEPFYNRTEFYQSPAPILPQVMNSANHNMVTHKPCIKCPPEITSIARQGLDGILVEPPAPVSCATNLPYSRDLYQIETLFGSKFFFVLPHGKHTLFAKIRNMVSGLIEHTCPLRYNVIVRRCQRYAQKNSDLRMFCSTGSIWGSSCTFACRNANAQLSHQEPIICNESLEWIGQEPNCIQPIVPRVHSTRSISIPPEHCPLPEPPTNGRYSCEMSGGSDDYQALWPGNICHINCNRFYAIPMELRRYGVIQCVRGNWNSTNVDVCQRERTQRKIVKQRNTLKPSKTRLNEQREPVLMPKRVRVTYNYN